jgi:Immunity protein 74
VHITWMDPHHVAVQIDGRHLHIGGEGLLGDDTDFVIYAAFIRQWDDGTPMSDEVKAATLDQVVHEAAAQMEVRDRLVSGVGGRIDGDRSCAAAPRQVIGK